MCRNIKKITGLKMLAWKISQAILNDKKLIEKYFTFYRGRIE